MLEGGASWQGWGFLAGAELHCGGCVHSHDALFPGRQGEAGPELEATVAAGMEPEVLVSGGGA